MNSGVPVLRHPVYRLAHHTADNCDSHTCRVQVTTQRWLCKFLRPCGLRRTAPEEGVDAIPFLNHSDGCYLDNRIGQAQILQSIVRLETHSSPPVPCCTIYVHVLTAIFQPHPINNLRNIIISDLPAMYDIELGVIL